MVRVSPRKKRSSNNDNNDKGNEENHTKKSRRTSTSTNANASIATSTATITTGATSNTTNNATKQEMNKIFHHLSIATSTKTTTNNANANANYKYLEKLEESGFLEMKLWPYFLQLISKDDRHLELELELSQCSYLIALLVNQKCNLRGNGSRGAGGTVSASATKSDGSSASGPLSFIYNTVTETNDEDGSTNTKAFEILIQHLLNYHRKNNDNNDNKITLSTDEESTKIKFLIIAYTTLTKNTNTFIKKTLLQLVGIGLWSFMPCRYRDLEIRKNNAFKRRWSVYSNKDNKVDDNANGKEMRNIEFYIPKVLNLFLSTLNQLDHAITTSVDDNGDDNDDDADTKSNKGKVYKMKNDLEFLHIVLQFILDLLSTTTTRRYLRPYLVSINFSVKCTISQLFKSFFMKSSTIISIKESALESTSESFNTKENSRLFVQLIIMLQDLETFSIQDNINATPLSKHEMSSLYHDRAHVLQKLTHRHYPNEFTEIIYAGVSMICEYDFLKRNLDRIVDVDVLIDVAHRLRLIHKGGQNSNSGSDMDVDVDENVHHGLNIMDEKYYLLTSKGNEEDNNSTKSIERKREYVTEVMLYHHVLRPTEEQSLSQLPLYPDEKLLWNPHLVPPGHSFAGNSSSSSTISSSTLALPKMNTQFLTFGDYLLRSFKLLRLESAYEIRSDLVDVIRRMKPVPCHGYSGDNYDDGMEDDNGEETWNRKRTKTEFHGWSRMGLELTDNKSCPVKLLKVAPPKLGDNIPAQVIAEITLDLKKCGERIRQEWDDIGEFDNLFMVGVDATRMDGGPAPTMDIDIGNENTKERVIPDEEDVTFPRRFGIIAVRGCMVLEVRDSEGNILSDPSRAYKEDDKDKGEKDVSKPKNYKRFLTVSLDPAQYAADATGTGSALGTKVYQMLNVVVRRKGKENNFKAVLETVRGLMQGSASINRSLPSWLQPVFLGYGDPSSASFSSKSMRSFAMNTTGVTPPDAALDYGDTFLDEKHLRESFPDSNIVVDGHGNTVAEGRKKYQIKMAKSADSSESTVSATSYPFPTGVNGNPVRFTPVQVKAIRSGLSPGLTLIVGPPGTGKTDVAVQIIANLYHSFPSQRTVLVTHSNAALNDLFAKVMARGDVDERYMLRLGSGERDLETDSEFDFTKLGRVNFILSRRAKLLEEVQLISESLGISGAAERGPDGSPSYTCETAEYFHLHHVQRRIQIFHSKIKDDTDESKVSKLFPFSKYFGTGDDKMTLAGANEKFKVINQCFTELAEYRPLELLRSQRQRTDYLLTKQARIVAMTCTHAAIARSHLVELGFQYDNVVMEEAGQMLDIETFVPLLLQRGETGNQPFSESRLKRISLIGDHHQLPPVVKNISFSKYSNLDQSLFTRLIRLGVPSIDLNKQGRARSQIASLYSWRYKDLGNLSHVSLKPDFLKSNAGLMHTHQIINVEDFEGRGESTPTAYFYQNMGEAEYAVALFQYMVIIGYPPEKISILTTYNGQKDLLNDIISQRCGKDTPLGGIRPGAISTVDHYQGQQNDYVILSLVRTKSVGHLRDIRRLIVAVSRARLGLYIFCRQNVFSGCHELRRVMDQFATKTNKLELVNGEQYPTERSLSSEVPEEKKYIVNDVASLGSIVHAMQREMCK